MCRARDKAFRLAKKESLKSNNSEYKLGCVIANKSQIVGSGYNLYKTHTLSPHPYKSIHAEFMAAMNAGFDIKGCTVYVYREWKNGTPAIAKPCVHCMKFLVELGVKKIVYSHELGYKEERVK